MSVNEIATQSYFCYLKSIIAKKEAEVNRFIKSFGKISLNLNLGVFWASGVKISTGEKN